MMNLERLLCVLCVVGILTASCGKNMDVINNCPNENTSVPLLLGLWSFTGTYVDGVLELETCDLETTLEVTERQFIYTSFFGMDCAMSATDPLCYKVENDIVTTSPEDSDFEFQQEIVTLTNNTLVLKTVSTSSIVVTENWER